MFSTPTLTLPVGLLLAGASLTSATPRHAAAELLQARAEPLQARQTPNESYCGYEPNQDTWNKIGASLFLDTYIKGWGYDDWVRNMESTALDKPDANLQCTSLSGDCDVPAPSCETFVQKTGTDNPTAGSKYYWIFTAISNAHTVFDDMHENYQTEAILDSLEVDNIVSDFGDMPSGNAFALGGAAMGLASGLSAFNAPVSASFGVLSATFGIVSQFASPPDPEATLNDQLTNYFEQAIDKCDTAVANLFGAGDQDAVPNPDAGYNWVPLANFFQANSFLTTDLYEDYNDIGKNAAGLMKEAMIVRIINDQKEFLLINTDIDSEDDCSDDDYWLDDQCYGFYTYSSYMTSSGAMTQCARVDNNPIPTMKDKYGMDLDVVFRNAYDCSKAHGDAGAIDVNNIPWDGSVAECFYNFFVQKGTIDSEARLNTVPL